MSSKRILFSGVQPTGGGLTLGNYIGTIQSWPKLQNIHECLFSIVDLHGITTRHDPKQIRALTYYTLAVWIASGVDPQKSVLFAQSQVSQHAELAWILSCATYMGELSRMTQFKDKSGKGQNVSTGLFIYPSLMAADILLYQTNLVPVGDDQKQHLELTRDLAVRMNNIYGPIFTVPEIYIPPIGGRIMSLQDPTAKMSKSDQDPHATIFLSDSDAVIEKKIKRAVTDSVGVVNYSPDQPGVKNLITIQAALTQKTPQEIVDFYVGKQYGPLKADTAEIVIQAIGPFRERVTEILGDRAQMDRVLTEGAMKARARAEPTLKKVKDALGFVV